jgi:hypothetical protein
MGSTFERCALYDQVWSEPLTTLAKKYGLSDNGLRKICKTMNIPLPSAGHWARIAAGQQIPRTPLPANADVTSYTSQAPTEATAHFRNAEDGAWLHEQEAIEERPNRVIHVEERPARWHAITSSLRAQIEKRVAEVQEP